MRLFYFSYIIDRLNILTICAIYIFDIYAYKTPQFGEYISSRIMGYTVAIRMIGVVSECAYYWTYLKNLQFITSQSWVNLNFLT